MPIVSSETIEVTPARGRLRRVFRHVADDGGVHGPFVEHRPEAEDANTYLSVHAAAVDASLVEVEHQSNLASAGEGAATFRYTTQAQFLVRLRAVYGVATGAVAVRIGRFFHLLNLTNNQLDALFGTANNTQRTALRNRLLRQHDLFNSVAAETGQ